MFLKGHWRVDTFVTNYLPLAILPVLYVIAKLWTRAPLVPYAEMDFVTSTVICCLECSFVCRCAVEMHFLGDLRLESAIVSLSEVKATVVVSLSAPKEIRDRWTANEYGSDRGRRCGCANGVGKGSASHLPCWTRTYTL